MHICACLHTLWQDWRAGQSKTRTRLLTVKVKTSQSLSHVCLDCSPQGFSACGSLQAGRAPAGQASVRMAIFIWRLLGSQTQLPGPAPQFTVTVLRQQALGQLGSGLQTPAWPSHQLPQRCLCPPPNVPSSPPRGGPRRGFPQRRAGADCTEQGPSTCGLHPSGAGPTPPRSLAHLGAGWAGACGHPLCLHVRQRWMRDCGAKLNQRQFQPGLEGAWIWAQMGPGRAPGQNWGRDASAEWEV